MGKRERKRDAKAPRLRLDELLARGDTRGAVEAAKLLVREEPGPASELLAVRAYAARIQGLIAEGLGKEAAGIAAIMRERFPAHLAPWASLLEDARLAAGDFDRILVPLQTTSGEVRTALEEQLLPWITDPAALGRSPALHPEDPLVSESRIIAELFEIVTSRLASTEEMARLGDVRRRSPLAPWKLLLRALDAFHRREDERARPNLAAIDPRSPAARAGAVLTDLIAGRQKPDRSSAEARVIDLVSGGRASVAGQLQSIERAATTDDRRTLRDELRALTRSFDKLSPYAVEQVRIALLAICGFQFAAEQIAALFHIGDRHRLMQRYGALVMEHSGAYIASDFWIAYADELSAAGELQPWQAAEIYLHALSLHGRDEDDHPISIRFDDFDFDDDFDDPSHEDDTAAVIEKVIAAHPTPAALARLAPFLDRLEDRELRRVLMVWRKADPSAPLPLIRLLRLAEKEQKYDQAVSWIRQGDRLNIIDPEYARLRLHLLFRRAEQLLGTHKREAAAELLQEIASRPGELPGDTGTYLLALQWVIASPAQAAEQLAELGRRGVVGEMVVAEVTGAMEMQFALPASQPSPEELLEGVRRGLLLFDLLEKNPRHSFWLIDRTEAHFGVATVPQLLAIGDIALSNYRTAFAWKASARCLELEGPLLYRSLFLRVEALVELHAKPNRLGPLLGAALSLAKGANDGAMANRIAAAARLFRYRLSEGTLSSEEIAAIVARERTEAMPPDPAAILRAEREKRSKQRKSKPRKKKGPIEP